jgi:hypothetical protein
VVGKRLNDGKGKKLPVVRKEKKKKWNKTAAEKNKDGVESQKTKQKSPKKAEERKRQNGEGTGGWGSLKVNAKAWWVGGSGKHGGKKKK